MFASLRPGDRRPTLAERLDRLNDTLQSLGQRLKEAFAEAVGAAVAGAVRDAVQGLLGATDQPGRFNDPLWPHERDEPTWHAPGGPLWAEDEDFVPVSGREPALRRQHMNSGWSEALHVALRAGLYWLRHQPRRRPVLTAVVVAVAAGLTALLAGPAVGAGAGVLASTAGLLLTAEALGPARKCPAG